MTEHARHARWSVEYHATVAAQGLERVIWEGLIPGSPAWDRHVQEHGEPQEAPEILANRGLWAESGGLYDE